MFFFLILLPLFWRKQLILISLVVSLGIILHKQADLRMLWNKFFVDAPKKTLLWIEVFWHIVLINLYQYSENTFCWGQLTVEFWVSSSVFQALSHKNAAFQEMCQLEEHMKTVENSNWHCDKNKTCFEFVLQ